MWGWIGEIAKVFQGLGLPGAVVLALLIVILIQYRMNLALLKSNDRATGALLEAMNNSTAAAMNVVMVLSRIEAQMGLPPMNRQ